LLMNEYHILFHQPNLLKEDEESGRVLANYTIGENFEGENPNEAYNKFKEKYPNATYLGTFSKELSNIKQ